MLHLDSGAYVVTAASFGSSSDAVVLAGTRTHTCYFVTGLIKKRAMRWRRTRSTDYGIYGAPAFLGIDGAEYNGIPGRVSWNAIK
jgi:hypothetical protein